MDHIDNLCVLIKQNPINIKEIKRLIKSVLSPYELSYFYYFSLFCIKYNKGDINLANILVKYIKEVYLKPFKGTVTLTFGEVAESHVGMEQLGTMADHGFKLNDLKRAQEYFENKGCKTLLIHLNEFLPEEADEDEIDDLQKAYDDPKYQAYVFVARNGLKCLTDDSEGKEILTEMLFYTWDTKLYNERRKIVQNKNARHNLNFDDEHQDADFEHGKGTTIAWNEVPILTTLKSKLINAFGEPARELKCEGNKYYSVGNTGVGFHGDLERRKVIGVRLGNKMNMMWTWFYNGRPRGKNVSIMLNPGDVYCMSEKTVGTDWAPPKKEIRHLLPPDLRVWKKKDYTLRHAAGAPKYTTSTPKLQIRNQRKIEDNEDITIGDVYYKPKKGKQNPKPEWTLMPQ